MVPHAGPEADRQLMFASKFLRYDCKGRGEASGGAVSIGNHALFAEMKFDA